MKLEILNVNNNIQKPVQGSKNASNAFNKTAPTQIALAQGKEIIPSAASDKSVNLQNSLAIEAQKAQTLAQAPVSYSFIRDINLPFSNKAKLFRLANGQKVVVLEKKGPTVLQTYYNVGSMNEPDELRGISHFNEHMAFNGSKGPQGKTLGSGDFFKIVNEMGAMTNASTGFSLTDYFISSQLLGDDTFDKSAFIQSQQLQYPEHTAEMVEKEKGPVTSEISMISDRPENIAMNNCVRNLFQIQTTSPDLVAGTIKNINNLTREKTLDYYNLWYTPDNCHTVVTGEVPAEKAMNTIAKYYNKTSSADIKRRKYQDFNGITSPVRVDVKMPKAQSSTVVLGFSGPQNNSTKENITMELLMTALLGYKNARLSNALNKIQSYAMVNVERIGNRPTDPKAIMIASQMTPEKTEDVIKTIYNEVSRIAATPLNSDELETAKKMLKMTFSKVSENSQLLNMLLGNALLDNDLNYIENYLPILETITAQDVSAFAKKYLDLNKASLSVVHPQDISDEKISANYQKANSQFNTDLTVSKTAKPSFGARIEEKTPDVSKIKQYKLANNMEIALNPNTSDLASGIISMRLPEPLNVKPALPAILGVILGEGTKTKNYDTFYKDVHKSGINLKFEVDFQSVNACVDSLAEDAGKTVDMVKEILAAPRFNEKSLDYAKKLVKEATLNTENSASMSALKEIFPNLSEFATKEELLASIDTVTLEEVQQFYENIKANSMAKGIFTAPFERRKELEQNLVTKLSSGMPNSNFKPYKVSFYESYAPIEQDKLIKTAEPKNQADIVQLFKFKTNYNPKDHAAFKILNTILGDGPSSRLFNDLRETQKLAYRVESNIDLVGNTGVLSLCIKTTTDDKEAGVQSYDNVKKSLDGFKKHIELLKNDFVSSEELEAAKLRIKTKLLNSVESSTSQTVVFNNAKDSLSGMNSLNESLKQIESITAQDIQNAARYIFSTPSVTSILASEDTIKNI